MPLVSAYLCPRTDVLFRTKEGYLLHLRELARKSLINKRMEREIIPLRESFAALRLSATRGEDMRAWLYKNQNEIVRLAFIYEPGRYAAVKPAALHANIKPVESVTLDTISSGQQVQVASNAMRPEGESMDELIAGSMYLESAKDKGFLILASGVLKFLPGLSLTRTTKGLSMRLYAEDWVFVARKALYEYRTMLGPLPGDAGADDRYSLARIIERRYPDLTFEKYKALCLSGLVGESGVFDEMAFRHWLNHQGEASVDLPVLSIGVDRASI